MYDVVFLVATIIFMAVMLIYVGVNLFRARNSRPVRLVGINSEISAATVDIGPYVKVISGKFAKTLDI